MMAFLTLATSSLVVAAATAAEPLPNLLSIDWQRLPDLVNAQVIQLWLHSRTLRDTRDTRLS